MKLRQLVPVVGLLPLGVAYAGDFDGSKPLICAPVEARSCVSGEACDAGLPADFGAPAFLRVDMGKKTIAGPQRTTRILVSEDNEQQLLLQGTELDFGWTLVIGKDDGGMTATLANHEGAFVLMGSCTPL